MGFAEVFIFKGVSLRQRRERLAVVGPNGAGKTTLLEIMLRRRSPATGTVKSDLARIGAIAQGGTDWMLDDSLASYLSLRSPSGTPESLARVIVAHKFPLALAQRPMRSLSPGERVRAALICLFQRSPAVELLILDEPTYSLDLVGQAAWWWRATTGSSSRRSGSTSASSSEEFNCAGAAIQG